MLRLGEGHSALGRQNLEGALDYLDRKLSLGCGIDVPIHFESYRMGKAKLESARGPGIHLPRPLVAPLPRPVEEDETAEGVRIPDVACVEQAILN